MRMKWDMSLKKPLAAGAICLVLAASMSWLKTWVKTHNSTWLFKVKRDRNRKVRSSTSSTG